ncbi:hypothetical protein LTS02_012058 [Friedmanniomyces endolithicus]|nr:hypothetical protein LTR75_014318 [Friedmanniomyces endolithicus]KAK0853125.1 hypothetical protein LTS02_012058 [Friedmanniomyces endolithicus]
MEADKVDFRRHVLVHLPLSKRLFGNVKGADGGNVAWMCPQVGRIWEAEGRWKESEELFPAAKEWLVEKLGEDHPDTLNAMVHLASTYRSSGRWNEAEGLDVKAMETWRTVLGPEHPDTLTSTANLAATYRSQGWWMGAEELEVKVIEAWSRVLGTELAIRVPGLQVCDNAVERRASARVATRKPIVASQKPESDLATSEEVGPVIATVAFRALK